VSERTKPGRLDVDGDELAEEVATFRKLVGRSGKSPTAVGAESEGAIGLKNLSQERPPESRATGTEDVGDQALFLDRAAVEPDELDGPLDQERVTAVRCRLARRGRDGGVRFRIVVLGVARHRRLLVPDRSRAARRNGYARILC
jgi:hypothetical protein